MISFELDILRCPLTGEDLRLISGDEVTELLGRTGGNADNTKNIKQGFLNISGTWFYPVIDDIILLLPVYALFTGTGKDERPAMPFDKKRVFEYYNQISYDIRGGLKVYSDTNRWVDYREVTRNYIRHSFTRAGKFLGGGKYLLDIASGPIGLPEYLALSNSFEYRICADISVNALIQARQNYGHRKGIYLCADITNIPLKENSCDAVLCQHTLYHIPRLEQSNAVNEMYRVVKPDSRLVIVYSMFYRSWFMNLSLLPVQLYRIARHFGGKAWVRLAGIKPRLYFYPHSLSWFRKNFSFGKNAEVYCWRSTNKYFLNIYIHKKLWGEKILDKLMKLEDKNSRFLARHGEYPLIVIKK
jgi:ubiquinone/menaquinone biosynthesis C-methylase UbiE